MASNQWLLIRPSQLENAHGRFAHELLKSEGLNGFQMADVDASGLPALGPGDMVVLTRCFLKSAEIESLYRAVEAGARLVCLHPSDPLARRFGWTPLNRVLYPAWIRIRDGNWGAGLPLQTHLPLLLCKTELPAEQWTSLADAVDAEWKPVGQPAVVRQRVGAGEVVLFFYDLPKAVARIRFGNPELTSLSTVGFWPWAHAGDLYEGWIDDRVIHLPQADFHTQLLAAVLTEIAPHPLARFWYYEEARHPTAMVFTSDDDGSLPEHFRELSDCLLAHKGRGTFYLMKKTRLSDAQARDMLSNGHTLAPHVNAMSEPDDLYFSFPACLKEETRLLKERFGTLSASLQAHCAPWSGYTTWVPELIRQGYRLLCAHISIPPHRVNKYMCGSGRPMKFVTLQGDVLDCWQQPFPAYDDSSFKKQVTERPAEYVAEYDRLVFRPAVDFHHTALGVASHPIAFATYSRPYIEGLFDLAYRAGAPIYNGDQWCQFLDRRNAAQMQTTVRQDGAVEWRVSGLSGKLPLMIPWRKPGRVEVNGKPVSAAPSNRLGIPYLFVPVEGTSGAETRVTYRSS